ncbi:MAG TPA: hypothetical protein VFH51_17835, partial [Myxococcota bacterium]|nr:hypothetical protein [Myxococcota bacterium]
MRHRRPLKTPPEATRRRPPFFLAGSALLSCALHVGLYLFLSRPQPVQAARQKPIDMVVMETPPPPPPPAAPPKRQDP